MNIFEYLIDWDLAVNALIDRNVNKLRILY